MISRIVAAARSATRGIRTDSSTPRAVRVPALRAAAGFEHSISGSRSKERMSTRGLTQFYQAPLPNAVGQSESDLKVRSPGPIRMNAYQFDLRTDTQ